MVVLNSMVNMGGIATYFCVLSPNQANFPRKHRGKVVGSCELSVA